MNKSYMFIISQALWARKLVVVQLVLCLCLSEGGLRSHLKAQIGTDIRVSSLISHDC